jgi:hypothetical protein
MEWKNENGKNIKTMTMEINFSIPFYYFNDVKMKMDKELNGIFCAARAHNEWKINWRLRQKKVELMLLVPLLKGRKVLVRFFCAGIFAKLNEFNSELDEALLCFL